MSGAQVQLMATSPAALPSASGYSQPPIATRPLRDASRTRATLYGRRHKPLGDPAPLACTVAKAALETILGATSLDSLVRWLAPELREQLARQHSLARRAGMFNPPPVTICRARVCRVSVRAAEVSIVAYCDDRPRAIAMRLEDAAGRWLVTAVEIG